MFNKKLVKFLTVNWQNYEPYNITIILCKQGKIRSEILFKVKYDTLLTLFNHLALSLNHEIVQLEPRSGRIFNNVLIKC